MRLQVTPYAESEYHSKIGFDDPCNRVPPSSAHFFFDLAKGLLLIFPGEVPGISLLFAGIPGNSESIRNKRKDRKQSPALYVFIFFEPG